MSLSVGTRLGPYEITGSLGAGGMGEVYRARDTELGREVAVKVLPTDFHADPDRLARFQREAQVLASLNHPCIAAIHGLERTGGVPALVMELVEGETLADRLVHGSVPLDETVQIAKQIADALEVAHDRGIVHRDLKPANVKVRPDGTVKVLDFGLAKAIESEGAGRAPARVSSTMSPTIISPAMTQAGFILGTAAYMAPEQAKGRDVDQRADIWAFGCVVYEMLTGRRAFPGDDVTDTLAAVVLRDPDWSALPPSTPDSIRSPPRATPRIPCSGAKMAVRRTPGAENRRSIELRPFSSTAVWFVMRPTRFPATRCAESVRRTEMPGVTWACVAIQRIASSLVIPYIRQRGPFVLRR